MMKAIIFDCDNCKDQFEIRMPDFASSANTIEIKANDLGRETDYIGFDVCKKCRYAILEIFERKTAMKSMSTVIDP